jgi:glutathione S-transferase
MTTVLWHIGISHYNEKARWALDYKSIPHVRRAPMPGMHGLYALAITRGAQRRLPVLELGDRRIGDSTAIIASLEAYRPDPPLYPANPADRVRALALEDFFDEHLGPALRRYVWHHTLRDPEATVSAVAPKAGPGRARALRRLVPIVRPAVRRDYGIANGTAASAADEIRAAMDRVEAELRPSGYLVGDGFSVADLSAAALFTPVLAPRQRPYVPSTLAPALVELGEELARRKGGAWIAEMYARHRGRSAEVPNRRVGG